MRRSETKRALNQGRTRIGKQPIGLVALRVGDVGRNDGGKRVCETIRLSADHADLESALPATSAQFLTIPAHGHQPKREVFWRLSFQKEQVQSLLLNSTRGGTTILPETNVFFLFMMYRIYMILRYFRVLHTFVYLKCKKCYSLFRNRIVKEFQRCEKNFDGR